MSLLDWIHDIGGKLKIVQVDKAPAPAAEEITRREEPVRVASRCVTLSDLMREINERDMQALSALPAELTVSFASIFEAAGVVTPSHGWDVEKLHDLLCMEPYSALEGEELTQAVLAQLEQDKATTEDLARDAVGRDQAIDAFEEIVRGKMQARSDARNRNISDMRAEIVRMENEIQRMENESGEDRQEWRVWYRKKTAYEKMMAGALACLLDHPIVTLSPDGD